VSRQGTDSASGSLLTNTDINLLPTPREAQLRAVSFVMRRVPDAAARREILDALFAPRPARTADPMPVRSRAGHGDPAHSQHPPESIGAWRFEVVTWARANGWPDARVAGPLNPDILAAYRAAHPGQSEPAAAPDAPAPRKPKPYVGTGAEAKRLRARIRDWGQCNGWFVSLHGALNPRLVEAYYAANPDPIDTTAGA
jgi:hypothetical protein